MAAGSQRRCGRSDDPTTSAPGAWWDGLPVGMMLVGLHFEESVLYRAVHAFEQSREWRRGWSIRKPLPGNGSSR